ncbi:MAG: PIN domain-containing protein [Actinobacteria bacterium]|nr:PIN domain-containing protein [Actinomycetota bacterium]
MSAALDANVLLYASDASSEFHERALKTLHELAEGRELLYLFWPMLMAYLRISTHPSIFANPLSSEDAIANISQLTERANVRTPGEAEDFLQIFNESTADLTIRGNLVPDAHVVALMRQYDVKTIISHDRDFRKFDGIKVADPFK